MSLLSFLNSRENAFGLDISELSLKLIKLKKKGPQIFLESYNEIDVPPGLIINGEIKKPEKLIFLINKLIKTCKGKKISHKEVISVLPEPKTFIKLIRLPFTEGENLPEIIQREIEHHIPLPLGEMYLDWQVIKNPFYTEEPDKIYVLAGASPKNITDQYTNLLEKAGLIPLALEIEAVSILRSLIKENLTPGMDDFAQIIIDFGATRTGLLIYDHGIIQFSLSLPISGTEITENIAQSLDLSFEQAEKIKIVCGLDKKKCRGSLRKILHSRIDQLVLNIKNAINFYKNHFPRTNKIKKVILCGGGANFINIDQILSQKLNLEVEIGNPWVNITKKNKEFPIPKNKSLSFVTAIGLALRGVKIKEEI